MNGRTVLIADDNAQVRFVVELMLKSKGFKVLQAASGNEALHLAQSHAIDLALIDFDMPGMHGQELAVHLTGVSPQSRVLFISGDAESDDSSTLQKPFTAKKLLDRVRNCLTD